MHTFRNFTSHSVAYIFLFSFCAQPAHADRRITCESNNYRYHYCRVSTGGRVYLDNELSRSNCRQGSSWGYDSRGIWVDNGCRAEFVIRDRYSSNDRDDDNDNSAGEIAAVVAIIGGLALAGTLLSSQSSTTSASNPKYPSQTYDSTFGDRGVPSWAVGTFAGFNTAYNSELELTISPSGDVAMTVDKQPLTGKFSDGRILMSDGGELDVSADGAGIRTVRRDAPQSEVRYVRIR
jgi:hypothetical protein